MFALASYSDGAMIALVMTPVATALVGAGLLSWWGYKRVNERSPYRRAGHTLGSVPYTFETLDEHHYCIIFHNRAYALRRSPAGT